MADRPHSRKVKVVEGTAEVKKGEKVESQLRASQREAQDRQQEKSSEKES